MSGGSAARQQDGLAQFADLLADAILGVDDSGAIVLANRPAEQLLGYAPGDLLGRPVAAVVPGGLREGEVTCRRPDGTVLPADVALSAVTAQSRALTVAAIRVAAAAPSQLNRLELVGRLAGGFAHDFNNVLGVILNYADFIADEVGPASPAWQDAQEIRMAAERGAALTRRLLLFGRRSAGRPELLDLNAVVAEVERLLSRALGEHVALATRLGPGLWRVRADPAAIEQLLVDLAVDARDAMPRGGRLIIETGNVELDEEFSALQPGARPGCYVRVVVSDTGTGLRARDAAGQLERTVAALGGHVHVGSRAGLGTTVKVHLPAELAAAAPPAPGPRPAAAHGETVLIVEGEDMLRRMSERILRRAGYRVVAAATARDALAACARGNRIDLLLTDVVMPEMLGPELLERAVASTPGLKVLYMSGYVQQVLGELDPEHAGELTFVEKPFTADALLKAVRRALDSRPA